MTFTTYEPLANVSYLAELVIWILTLILWIYPPQLWAVAMDSWRQTNAETGVVYITRFLPYGLFRFLSYLLGSLSGGLILLRLGVRLEYLPAGSYQTLALQLAGLSLGIYLFLYLRSMMFRLWRYILFDSGPGALLWQDYFLQDWLRALLLALLSLLSFTSLSTGLLVGLTLGTLAVVQVLGWVQVLRRYRGASSGLLLLFLYLCAHEVVPLLYLIAVGTYLTRSPLLPNL